MLPAKSHRRFSPQRSVMGAAAAMAAFAAIPTPAAFAQEYELVTPYPEETPQASVASAISLRAQVDVIYTPPGASEPVLVQRAFETRATALNLSSEYVFEILNTAALAGVEQALAGGAQAGRVSVVAVCYLHGAPDGASPTLAPMGVFINTTDLNVLPDGNAALRTRVKVIPPGR